MTYPFEDSTLSQGEGIPPVDVRVIAMPIEKERNRKIRRTTFRTIVLSASRQFDALLDGPDPTRVQYWVKGQDSNYVLSGSQSDAQDPANTTSGLPNPVGAFMDSGRTYGPFTGQTEVWVSTPLLAAAVNRITVISVHEVEM